VISHRAIRRLGSSPAFRCDQRVRDLSDDLCGGPSPPLLTFYHPFLSLPLSVVDSADYLCSLLFEHLLSYEILPSLLDHRPSSSSHSLILLWCCFTIFPFLSPHSKEPPSPLTTNFSHSGNTLCLPSSTSHHARYRDGADDREDPIACGEGKRWRAELSNNFDLFVARQRRVDRELLII
jgi:hypothetical protein